MSNSTATPSQTRGATAKAALLLLFLLLVLAALFATGLMPKLRQRAELANSARAAGSEVPTVTVVSPKRAAATQKITLPGNVEAIQAASIYARTNGYIRSTLVGIGDRVKAGQLLAELDAPETEQELRQARATVVQWQAALKQKRAALSQAKANLALAEVTLKRWKELVQQGVFAAQSGDEKQSAYDSAKASVEAAEADIGVAEANLAAQQANVRRIEELKGYEKIVAPFDGIITGRPVDAGALVTAGSTTGVREIYRMAATDRMRIYVPVPQAVVPQIQVGREARLIVQEYPGRQFPAKVVRASGGLDAATRTQIVELHIANPDDALKPGMYAQVEFETIDSVPRLLVPAAALVVRADGSYAVAALGPDSKIHYRRLATGRDFGAETEVLGGLNGDERMVVNPSDDLTEGSTVSVVAPKK